jgi:hypothetical protein
VLGNKEMEITGAWRVHVDVMKRVLTGFCIGQLNGLVWETELDARKKSGRLLKTEFVWLGLGTNGSKPWDSIKCREVFD